VANKSLDMHCVYKIGPVYILNCLLSVSIEQLPAQHRRWILHARCVAQPLSRSRVILFDRASLHDANDVGISLPAQLETIKFHARIFALHLDSI